MKFGYFGLNVGTFDHPDAIERLVVAAEQLDFESIWTGEHVILVDPQVAPSPVPPHSPFVDTIASLAFAAAKTTRIKIGSGIILIAQRDPIVLAKELAGIDVLSKGRLLVGVGVGYVKGEFDALGIPFDERGPRASEHIEVLRTLWTSEKPAFDGKFTKFAGIQSRPLPGPEAASADPCRGHVAAGAPPGGRPGQRLVRVLPGRGRDEEDDRRRCARRRSGSRGRRRSESSRSA